MKLVLKVLNLVERCVMKPCEGGRVRWDNAGVDNRQENHTRQI